MRHSVKSTLVSGVVFLLPVTIVVWLLQKVGGLVTKLAQPAMKALPERLAGNTLAALAVTGLVLLVVVYLAGHLARTAAAQRLIQSVYTSVIGTLPQFSFVRGITESMDGSNARRVEVVLVPADAGWAMGFIFDPGDEQLVAVFLPGSPQWASGSVVFADRTATKPAGIDFAQAIRIQKRLGADADAITRAVSAPQSATPTIR